MKRIGRSDIIGQRAYLTSRISPSQLTYVLSDRPLSAEVQGSHIQSEATHEQVPISLLYGFDGDFADGGSISGNVRLGGTTKEHLGPVFKGQYGSAEWHATRVCGTG